MTLGLLACQAFTERFQTKTYSEPPNHECPDVQWQIGGFFVRFRAVGHHDYYRFLLRGADLA